jgi:peptide/nickel transport system permease protein
MFAVAETASNPATTANLSETSRPGLDQRRRRHGRMPLPALIGLLVVLFWIVVALTVQWWAPYDPLQMVARRLRPPSAEHWLGTDALGRDVLTRTLFGAQQSLPISVVVVLAGAGIGSALGAIAGFLGGIVDAIIMRAVDITLSLPAVLLAMAVAASIGPGLTNATIAMIIVWWPLYARLMRAEVMSVKRRDHVDAAIAGGAGPMRLLTRHILPLCWTPVLINATMDFGQVVLLTASLSFIGLGARPPSPEWGAMISEGATDFYYWWVAFGPGLAILSVVMGTNFLGDALRDALDPRSRA